MLNVDRNDIVRLRFRIHHILLPTCGIYVDTYGIEKLSCRIRNFGLLGLC